MIKKFNSVIEFLDRADQQVRRKDFENNKKDTRWLCLLAHRIYLAAGNPIKQLGSCWI